jgi:hypothetical protein
VNVTVSGTSGCARTATSNAAWITVTAGATGTGAGTVSLSVAANSAGTSRTGTVTIGGQTFTVTQAGSSCMEWGVTPQSYSAGMAGGTATVTAIGSSGCSRTASSNAAWITVTSGASGTGSGNVTLAIAANDGSSRVGTATVAGKTVTVSQAGAAPVVISSLTANRSFPAPTGTVLTWTAAASGGSGALEYQYWRYRSSTGVWQVVRDYSTTNTYSWAPSAGEGGSYALQVWVRSVGSTATYQAYRSFGYFDIVGAKPLKVTLAPADASGPHVAGRETRWTAIAEGGIAPTQFKFWVHSAATGWVMLQDYGTNGTLSWTPAKPGQYALQAWVRNPGSTASYDAWTSSGYFEVVAGTQTVALEFSRPLPSPVNVPITLTAVGRGPAEPLEYKFWVNSGGAWSVLRDYSTTATVTWTPSTAGNKSIQVWSRRVGATDMEAWTGSGWVTIGNAPVTLTQFTANQTFPLPAGTPITWRAQASGGTAALQYQFWRLSNGAWTIVQPYGSSNTYTWTPQSSQSGTHAVQVWVRSTGSTSAQEAWASSGFIQIAP